MVCREGEIPKPGTAQYFEWQNDDKGPSIIIVCWVFTALALLFLVARRFVRGHILKKFHADDLWCSLGWICACLSSIFATISTSFGNGQHCIFNTPYEQGRIILWTVIAWAPGMLCFSLPKLAVVSLLTRLLNPSRYHKWFLWGLPIFALVNLLVTFLLILFRCSPIRAQWEFYSVSGNCLSDGLILGFSLYAAVFSAFVDLYLSIYPSIVLYRLQLPRKKKIYLSIALGLGLVSCVVAIYKTTRLPPGLSDKDVSYSASDLTIWTVVEGCTIIMACTVPVLAPLLDVFRCRKSTRGSGSSGLGAAISDKSDENRARHRRHHEEADPTSTSTSGDNNQDIVLRAWDTIYGSGMQNQRHDSYSKRSTAGDA